MAPWLRPWDALQFSGNYRLKAIRGFQSRPRITRHSAENKKNLGKTPPYGEVFSLCLRAVRAAARGRESESAAQLTAQLQSKLTMAR